MPDVERSVFGVPVRLTDERWQHIVSGHPELGPFRARVLDAIARPHRVLEGGAGESLALSPMGDGKWLVVVYRERAGDGFVATAFLTRRTASLERRRLLWPR